MNNILRDYLFLFFSIFLFLYLFFLYMFQALFNFCNRLSFFLIFEKSKKKKNYIFKVYGKEQKRRLRVQPPRSARFIGLAMRTNKTFQRPHFNLISLWSSPYYFTLNSRLVCVSIANHLANHFITTSRYATLRFEFYRLDKFITCDLS